MYKYDRRCNTKTTKQTPSWSSSRPRSTRPGPAADDADGDEDSDEDDGNGDDGADDDYGGAHWFVPPPII